MARGAARRGTRPKGDNITFPLEAWGVESINKNFDALFKDLHSTSVGQLLDGEHIDTASAAAEVGALIYGTNTTPSLWDILPIGAVDTVLRTEGIVPEWNKVHLTTDVDEILPVANGGTNNSSYTAGSVIFAGAGGTQLVEDNATFFFDDATNLLTLAHAGVATTTADPVVRLHNPTAATAGVTRQFSPALIFSGSAWDIDGGGASSAVRNALYLRTFSGSAPTGFLAWAEDNGTGVFSDQIYIGRAAVEGDVPSLRFNNGNLAFVNNGSRGIYFSAAPLTDDFSGNNQKILGYSDGTIEFVTLGSFVRLLGNTASVAAGTPMFDIRGFDGGTATPMNNIRSRATPGGAPAVGFGSQFLFQANSSTTADQDQGVLGVVWSDVTHATRSADFVMQLVDAAAALAEKFRFASTGLATIPSINVSSGALGNVRSDVYTPTRSAEANLDANVTMSEAQWMRVRNTVTVSGRFTADPTTTLTATSFEMTLPIASNIGAVEDVAGVAACGSIASMSAAITGSVANNTAVVSWIATDVTSQTWSFTFTYQVI